MTAHGDMTPGENRQLAVASATLGPWRTAAAVGTLGGAAALGVDVLTGDWSLGILAGPVSLALFLFFLVGGVGSVTGRAGGDRRLRRWAAEHPWRVAAVPAVLLLVLDTAARSLLSSASLAAALWDGVWHAVLLAAVVGVVGSVAGARARR
ncbi:hypothetical protein [Streptacidiphilus sp. ASG 303]|uniref:hypothetical protein n=1 Tax=Streptomycetaceae TaxID=2062 RepID=UPI001E4C0B31|nr:hypothetical protein [Streptacidiphilus sp. ASG 303]MCD0485253.1 hypothetical protein [Streptacidiphilus sp. ASG 303]